MKDQIEFGEFLCGFKVPPFVDPAGCSDVASFTKVDIKGDLATLVRFFPWPFSFFAFRIFYPSFHKNYVPNMCRKKKLFDDVQKFKRLHVDKS